MIASKLIQMLEVATSRWKQPVSTGPVAPMLDSWTKHGVWGRVISEKEVGIIFDKFEWIDNISNKPVAGFNAVLDLKSKDPRGFGHFSLNGKVSSAPKYQFTLFYTDDSLGQQYRIEVRSVEYVNLINAALGEL